MIHRIKGDWIFGACQKKIDRYPDLEADMKRVAGQLDDYANGRISTLPKSIKEFEEKSFQAFRINGESLNDVRLDTWENLKKEFVPPIDPRLAEISRLFCEPDSTENRALILLKIWQLTIEFSKFKIREPEQHWHSWRDCPEFVARLANRGTTNG
jgi:hypothetical protein